MRLLRVGHDDLELVHIEGRVTESYAILSHTWGTDEVMFNDVEKKGDDRIGVENKAGYRKISFALAQAHRDRCKYLWVDTCCIDKSSSADLSEAINSMFRYYERAAVCYVYLSDVKNQHDLKDSRWFKRGWTLQELLAPRNVYFFSHSWGLIGNKRNLQTLITAITGISGRILLKQDPISSESVAKRMFWASDRATTRVEDTAYCLMGIFGINMPLLYGEEENAFIRLQEEIMKTIDDQTLFAWIDPDAPDDRMCGLLAQSPSFFLNSAHYEPCEDPESEEPPSMVTKRMKIEVRFADNAEKLAGHQLSLRNAVLSCIDTRQSKQQVSISLKSCSASKNEYRRIRCSTLGLDSCYPSLTSIYVPQAQPVYSTWTAERPKDYIIHVTEEEANIRTRVELIGCTYRTRPDFKKHGITHNTDMYPKYSGHQVPRMFVGESYSNRMAVALHYVLRTGLKKSVWNVTILFGMKNDLTFGCNVLPCDGSQSLEELQNKFSPETGDTVKLPLGISQVTVNFNYVRGVLIDSALVSYDIHLRFKYD